MNKPAWSETVVEPAKVGQLAPLANQTTMNRWLISILLITTCMARAQPTVRLADSANVNNKPVFYPLPVLSYAQETSLQVGGHGLYAFRLATTDSITRSSTLSATAIYTLKKQFLTQAQADLWAPENQWHYQLDGSYRYFPFNYYGTGNRTTEQNKASVTENKVALHASVERKIYHSYYAGLHAGVESYAYTTQSVSGLLEEALGSSGGKLWFAELLHLVDSRDNLNYPKRGSFLKAGLRYVHTVGTSPAYRGWLLQADMRAFRSLAPAFVLGLQVAYRHYLSSSELPFYLMHQLGGDQLMRGYYIGRYRDKGLLASQLELRYRLSREVGLIGFGGGGFVYGEQRFLDAQLKPSWGCGIRYFPGGDERLTLRLDYGMGIKQAGEKRQSGFYFSLGQSF